MWPFHVVPSTLYDGFVLFVRFLLWFSLFSRFYNVCITKSSRFQCHMVSSRDSVRTIHFCFINSMRTNFSKFVGRRTLRFLFNWKYNWRLNLFIFFVSWRMLSHKMILKFISIFLMWYNVPLWVMFWRLLDLVIGTEKLLFPEFDVPHESSLPLLHKLVSLSVRFFFGLLDRLNSE